MIAHISDSEPRREESVLEHTVKTSYLCSEKGRRCGIENIMLLCGIIHDMGKNKKSFDEYIHGDENMQKKLRGKIAHASTGAKYIYDKYHNSEKQNIKILTELISYAAAAHHGLFDCVDIEKTNIFLKKVENVEDYEEACENAKRDYLDNYNLDEIFYKALCEFESIQLKLKCSFGNIKELLKEKYKERPVQDIKKSLYKYTKFFYSCLQRLILSVLIDSDWEATSDFMDGSDTLSKQILPDMKDIFEKADQNFEIYMKNKQMSVLKKGLTNKEKEIIDARNVLQNECKQFAKNPAGIYCLPIPTGGGKTLSSLAYALQYIKKYPKTERVIYVSPYISITEQNAEVFRNALGNAEWILEHHSSVIKSEEEYEDYQNNKFSKIDINWEEPFICTTFVQFMNALFSDKKKSIRLMHRLVNAVVIIDEVQSMPLKCVNTINYMINFLNVVCNTNIILCTATQPTLEETNCPVCYSKPKYMIENAKKWFEIFKRVEICIPKQTYTFDSLKDEIVNNIQRYHSILIVLNTKSAVRKLYDLLSGYDIYVEYLTTNLCAEHRSDKIKQIKEILEKQKENIVVVSTNLIEAGVDISFECVYRSMAGLDSLAQSAGRCNRNGEMNHGKVHFIKLEGENTGNMEELCQNIDVAKHILYYYEKEGGTDNLLAPKWINEYYKYLYSEAGSKMDFPIKKNDTNILQLLSYGYTNSNSVNIMNQAYQTAGKEYQIIDDNSFGIIVPYKRGKELIESIQQTDAFSEMKKYIRSSQRYTVNVRGSQMNKMVGLIQLVTEKVPNLYMVSAPGAYHEKYGITEEWEPLII